MGDSLHLSEIQDQYKFIVENSLSGIYIFEEGKFIYVNRACEDLTGYTKDELLNKNYLELIHPDDRAWMQELTDKVLRGEIKKIQPAPELRIIHKNGTARWVRLIPNLINIGDKVRIISNMVDIDSQKKLEEALKKSERTFRELIERANDGIAIIQDKKFKYVNKKLTEMHGYPAGEMCGDYFHHYISEAEKSKVIDRNQRRTKGESVPTIYQSEILTKKGKTIPVEFNAGMVTYNGKPANLVLVRDITERKKAEDILKKSLKEKDVLLREIHHRVKNNMQIMSSLLRLQAAGTKDKMAKKILQESRGRIYTMALVHEKLYQSKDLSNIDMGRYIQVFVPHLFHTFDASAQKISLHMQCESVELDITRAIPCGLIINELVSNAIKHAFPGDRKGKMCIDLCREKGKIIFGVKDNGVGLPEHVDVRQSETMGFQIVNDLVKQLRADMKIISENGIKFEIDFPA